MCEQFRAFHSCFFPLLLCRGEVVMMQLDACLHKTENFTFIVPPEHFRTDGVTNSLSPPSYTCIFECNLSA